MVSLYRVRAILQWSINLASKFFHLHYFVAQHTVGYFRVFHREPVWQNPDSIHWFRSYQSATPSLPVSSSFRLIYFICIYSFLYRISNIQWVKPSVTNEPRHLLPMSQAKCYQWASPSPPDESSQVLPMSHAISSQCVKPNVTIEPRNLLPMSQAKSSFFIIKK